MFYILYSVCYLKNLRESENGISYHFFNWGMEQAMENSKFPGPSTALPWAGLGSETRCPCTVKAVPLSGCMTAESWATCALQKHKVWSRTILSSSSRLYLLLSLRVHSPAWQLSCVWLYPMTGVTKVLLSFPSVAPEGCGWWWWESRLWTTWKRSL